MLHYQLVPPKISQSFIDFSQSHGSRNGVGHGRNSMAMWRVGIIWPANKGIPANWDDSMQKNGFEPTYMLWISLIRNNRNTIWSYGCVCKWGIPASYGPLMGTSTNSYAAPKIEMDIGVPIFIGDCPISCSCQVWVLLNGFVWENWLPHSIHWWKLSV